MVSGSFAIRKYFEEVILTEASQGKANRSSFLGAVKLASLLTIVADYIIQRAEDVSPIY